MKTRKKNRLALIALALSLVLSLTPSIALAVEVEEGENEISIPIAEGATEVSIPIVLVTGSEAIAGAELQFSFSQGLEYLSYQPAEGIENPVTSAIENRRYAGFFSADNRYLPANERLEFGTLVFNYSGSQAESVTMSEISLHTKSGSGAETSVTTRKTSEAVTIPVTRASAGATGNEGTAGNSGSTNTGTASNTTSPSATTTTAGTGAATVASVELDASTDAELTTSTLSPTPANGSTTIPDAALPLADLLATGDLPLAQIVGLLLLAAALVGGVLYYLLVVRKKRLLSAEAAAAQDGTEATQQAQAQGSAV